MNFGRCSWQWDGWPSAFLGRCRNTAITYAFSGPRMGPRCKEHFLMLGDIEDRQ